MQFGAPPTSNAGFWAGVADHAADMPRDGSNDLAVGRSEEASPLNAPSDQVFDDASGDNSLQTRPRAIAFAQTGRKSKSVDMRDVLIYQQIRRIDELEQQVDMLRAQLQTEQERTQLLKGGSSERAPEEARECERSYAKK